MPFIYVKCLLFYASVLSFYLFLHIKPDSIEVDFPLISTKRCKIPLKVGWFELMYLI